jgi:hypothetical protein
MRAISWSIFASPECAASAISQDAAVAGSPLETLWQALDTIKMAIEMRQNDPFILFLSDKSLIPDNSKLTR